jgi:hypothetical protein
VATSSAAAPKILTNPPARTRHSLLVVFERHRGPLPVLRVAPQAEKNPAMPPLRRPNLGNSVIVPVMANAELIFGRGIHTFLYGRSGLLAVRTTQTSAQTNRIEWRR